MKAQVKKDVNFSPITVSITLETKEEVNDLFARLNVSNDKIQQSYLKNVPKSHDLYPSFWEKVFGSDYDCSTSKLEGWRLYED